MTLVVLFFVSVFLTTTIIGSLLTLHLVSRIRDHGVKDGSIAWVQEVKDRFFAISASITSTSQPPGLQSESNALDPNVSSESKEQDFRYDRDEDDRGSNAGSVASTVVVALGADSKQEVKDDPDADVICDE